MWDSVHGIMTFLDWQFFLFHNLELDVDASMGPPIMRALVILWCLVSAFHLFDERLSLDEENAAQHWAQQSAPSFFGTWVSGMRRSTYILRPEYMCGTLRGV